MVGAEEPERGEIDITTLVVGALTGQYELSDADRQTIGEWMIDHAADAGVRALLIKMVRTEISDTSEFRVKVAEAIRDTFGSAATAITSRTSWMPCQTSAILPRGFLGVAVNGMVYGHGHGKA